MKTRILSMALCLALAACGDGNPFEEDGTTDPTDPDNGGVDTVDVPEVLSNDLQGFTYNPSKGTLVISGVTSDDSPFTAEYRRRKKLDRAGYEAFTQQDGSLDRHSTAYVKKIRGTQAVVVVTGGQFQEFFSGTGYDNTSYTAPVARGSNQKGGLISYAGRYVGLLNGPGSGEDLMPVKNGTPAGFRPRQAAEVTGRALITGSFSDRAVDGVVTKRRIRDYNMDIDDLALDASGIENNGSFTGTVSQDNQAKGTYGGIFGGRGATEVAGSLKAENHIDDLDDEIEYGIFVLGACGKKGQDPVCKQPKP